MPKTLIEAVNDILTRTGAINAESGALTTLISASKQRSINVAVQAINEGIDELFSSVGKSKPTQQAASSITLTFSRSYTLETDLIRLHFPLIDRTNNQFITEYPGGFNEILIDDPEQDDTGLPLKGAINPQDGKLYLDQIPDSNAQGKIYHYTYDRDLELSAVADQVPFNNTVYRALIPVWVQIWRREMDQEFDKEIFNLSFGRASRLVSRVPPRDNYNPRR